MKVTLLPKSPKILLYDIESSPNVSYTWGKWEQDVIKFVRQRQTICIAWKWLDSKKIYCSAMPMFPSYTRDKHDNASLMKSFHRVLSSADIVVAHNGISFDNRRVNTDFVKSGLKPPAPFHSVDTLRIARAKFDFNSNKLDDLGEFLGLGRKVKHPGFEMWEGCMHGDPKSWAQMIRYNKGDIALLEKVYLKLRPWDARHPDITKWTGGIKCSVCSSENLIHRGEQYNKVTYRIRLLCKDCGKWNTGKLMKKRS